MTARLVIIIGLWLILFPKLSWSQHAQEVLGPDNQQLSTWIPTRPQLGRAGRDTIRISPTTIFVDDFSKGSVPDSGFWYLGAGRYPLIRRQSAENPASFGTATFDGISPFQQVYSTVLGRGPADRLETHYLDLSIQDPDNELYLSFDVQPKGYSHAPISKDSFKVYFNALNNGVEEEIQMVALAGTGLGERFQTFSIPISESRFFHDHFYIAFENEGLLNGMLSAWQLDYVALGIGRTPTDTLFNDRAIVRLERPLFDPYSAIPFMQYSPNTFSRSVNVDLQNLGGGSGNSTISHTITDPVGNNLSPAYTGSASQSFSGAMLYQTAITVNDNQTLATPYASTFQQKISISGNTDLVAQNDELTYEYRIDSLMAYDDGEADVGYGINRIRGFAQKYVLQEADTLMAVWMHFVPQINYVFGGSLSGKIFSLGIWTSPNRDSLIYEEGFPITYGNTPDHFERYELEQPISVSGDIWVGILQNDNVPVGIGMDRTWVNDSLISWDSSGVWVNSRLRGTLMIRPELRNIRYNPLPFPASVESTSQLGNMTVFPSPVTQGNSSTWKWEGTDYQSFKIKIFDIQGRIIWQHEGKSQREGTLPELPAGMYFMRYSIQKGAQWHQQSQTLQILPR